MQSVSGNKTLWLVEAERRLEELRTGEAKGIDAPKAL
ncbi:MAG: addiction module protein [Terriglobia bacterium]